MGAIEKLVKKKVTKPPVTNKLPIVNRQYAPQVISTGNNVIRASGTTPTPSALDRRHGALDPTPEVDVNQWLPKYTGTPQQEARDNVDLEYNQRLRALRQAAEAAQRNQNYAMDTEVTYGREVDPRLAEIYSALGNSLQQNAQQNQGTYNSAIDRIRGFYDEAGQSNQTLNQDLLTRITEQAQRLGVEQGLPAGTQDLNNDYQFQQMQNTNAKAGRSANLAQLAAGIGVLDNNRVGAAAQEGAQQRATLQNEMMRVLGELGIAGFEEQGAYRNQMSGLEQDRATANRDELARITQQRFENDSTGRRNALDEFLARSGLNLQEAGYRNDVWRDDRDFNYNRSQDAYNRRDDTQRWNQEFNRGNFESDRNFGLARDQFGLERSSTAFQQQLQRDELNIRRQQLQYEMEQANSPEQRRLIQQEIARNDAELAILQGTAGTSSAEYPKGDAGYYEFIKNNSLPPIYNSRAREIIEMARKEAMTANPTGSTPDASSQYDLAMSILAQGGEIQGLNRQTLRQLLDVYYNGLTRPG